jgi:hypothetical protein
MRWRHEVKTVIADAEDELVDPNEFLSTTNYANWPEEALVARAAAGLPTRCEPRKVRCRLTERCRLCGAKP